MAADQGNGKEAAMRYMINPNKIKNNDRFK